MKRSLKVVVASFALATFFVKAPLAQADTGFYIEPAIQYISGTGTFSGSGLMSNATTSTYGLGFDLKAGVAAADILFAGLDGSYSTPQYVDGSRNNYSASSTLQQLGVFVGAQMPIVGLRIWGDYIFSSVYDPSASNGMDYKFSNGNGFKLGAGFHILIVSLNLEYEDVSYGATDVQPAALFGNSSSLHDKRWILGVSFPITL